MPRRRARTEVRFDFETRDNASEGIDRIGDSMERVGGSDGQSGLVGGLNLGMTALAGSVIAGGAALAANAGRWLDHANQVRRSSEALDVNLEQYQRIHHAFTRFGYDATDVDSILAELEIKTYDWRDGTAAATAAFEELGLQLDDFDRLAPDEKLDEVAAALANVESNSRRIGIADTIFGGDDARKVLDVAASLETLGDQAERFGLIVDQEAAAAAEHFTSNIRTMEAFLEGGANRVAEWTIGVFNPAIDGMLERLGLAEPETQVAMDGVLRVLGASESELAGIAERVGYTVGYTLGEQIGLAADLLWQRWRNNFIADVERLPTVLEQSQARFAARQEQNRFSGGLLPHLYQPTLDGFQLRPGAINRDIYAGPQSPSDYEDISQVISGGDPSYVAPLTPEQIAAVAAQQTIGDFGFGVGGGYGGSFFPGNADRPAYQRPSLLRPGLDLGTYSDADVVAPQFLGANPFRLPLGADLGTYAQGEPRFLALQALAAERERESGRGGGSSGYSGSGGGRGYYGGGGGAGGGQTINIEVNFHFGEGVVTDNEIIERVQTGFNYREIATDIGQRVAAACS